MDTPATSNEGISLLVERLPEAAATSLVPASFGPCEPEEARLYIWQTLMDLRDEGHASALHLLMSLLSEKAGERQEIPAAKYLGGCI